jgi:CheY-like chemotaxis protein
MEGYPYVGYSNDEYLINATFYTSKFVRILIAEDEQNIALTYRSFFEDRNHQVVMTNDGAECVKEYQAAFDEWKKQATEHFPETPFDAVILDYKMPRKDGMEVAREILALSPKQRIIFASAYVLDTLQDSVKELGRVTELVQKPFEIEELISLVEDEEIWKGLEELNTNVEALREFRMSHDTLVQLLEGLKKLQGRALGRVA